MIRVGQGQQNTRHGEALRQSLDVKGSTPFASIEDRAVSPVPTTIDYNNGPTGTGASAHRLQQVNIKAAYADAPIRNNYNSLQPAS